MSLSITQQRSISILAFTYLVMPGYTLAESATTGSAFLSADQNGSQSADKLFSGANSERDTKEGWSGEAQAGLVSSSGNADNNSITAGISAIYNKQPWRHTLASDIYFADNNGEKTAERFAASHKLDYALTDTSYVFNFFSFDTDEFANIDSRLSDVIGYGKELFKNEKHILTGETGLGVRQTKHIDATPNSDEAVGHLGIHYKGQLTDTTTLTKDLTIQSGKDNTFTESITALQVEMTEKLSLSLNYSIRNNTYVPETLEKTDTVTSINLVNKF